MAAIILPVPSESWEQHFASNGWSSPEDQVTAGYPLYIQPAAASATYQDIVDLGATISQVTTVSLSYLSTIISGVVTISASLAVSPDGSSWTDYPGQVQITAGNFQYVRVTITGTPTTPASLVKLESLRIRVAVKKRRDSGAGAALAADSTGTTVVFNVPFIDVETINITAAYQVSETNGITAVYNFTDVPNPTSFKVLLYSNNTGARINGAFSWEAIGA